MLLLKDYLKRLSHLFMPPVCFACLEPKVMNDGLCSDCFQKITFIEKPYCALCGIPFDVDVMGDNAICGACVEHPPAYDEARSATLYDAVSKKIILKFKNNDRLEMRKIFKPWLLKIAAPYLEKSDIIMPVPLSWFKLLKRRYNQAAVLAKMLSKETAKPYNPFILKARRSKKEQKSLTRDARFQNLSKIFYVNPKNKALLKNKTILLIDDVMTTGATAHFAAKTLKKAGAQKVYVLCLARVTRQH